MKYVLLCFVLLLVCVPGARGDLVSARNYQTNWVEPALRSVFTSSQGPVSARLLVDAHTFDTGNAKTKGKLQICRKGRVSFAETFVSNKGKADIVRISGPRLIAGKGSDEPAVLLEVQCYQKVDAYEYDFDKKAGQYQKQKPSINPVDARNQGTKMEGVRKVTCGNTGAVLHWQQELCDFGGTDWMLNIKKGCLVLFSGPVELPANLTGAQNQKKKDLSPECFGPFVTTALGRSGKTFVDLRLSRIVDSSRLSCELIYYYDRPSRKMKVSAHEWGLNTPRLAHLRQDGQIQFMTEDWSLSKPDMGGPLQIWQWGKPYKLVNVTRKFPSEIRKHARAALAEWQAEHDKASLLGYVGDLCLLGQKARAVRELKRLDQAGETTDRIIHKLQQAGYL